MWTVHQSACGVAYYYNAALNQSVWFPPSDAIVHVAARPLMTIEDYRLYLEEHSSIVVVNSIDRRFPVSDDKQLAYIPQPQLQQSYAESILR